MKKIKTISREFNKISGIHSVPYEIIDIDYWKYYGSISGFVDGSYISVYFIHTKKGYKEIEICNITDNPEDVFEMLKSIEPEQKIKHTISHITLEVIEL